VEEERPVTALKTNSSEYGTLVTYHQMLEAKTVLGDMARIANTSAPCYTDLLFACPKVSGNRTRPNI
jgi:hypothetical protein